MKPNNNSLIPSTQTPSFKTPPIKSFLSSSYQLLGKKEKEAELKENQRLEGRDLADNIRIQREDRVHGLPEEKRNDQTIEEKVVGREGKKEEGGGWKEGGGGWKDKGRGMEGVGWDLEGGWEEGEGWEGGGLEEEGRREKMIIKLKKGIMVLKEEKEKLMGIIQEDLEEKIRKRKEFEEPVKEDK